MNELINDKGVYRTAPATRSVKYWNMQYSFFQKSAVMLLNMTGFVQNTNKGV